MFDTMTVTKTAAALCGALLVFLLGSWVAEELYHTGVHDEASYVIDTGEEEVEEEVVEVSFAELMAAADPGKGERVYRKCAACHKLEDGANSTGPYLYNVVGREVAAAEGFGYSDAMIAHGGVWDAEHLNEFLIRPSGLVPGTSMSFSGLKDVEDRVNLIAYLNTQSDAPQDFSAAAETTDEAATETATGTPEEGEAETAVPTGEPAVSEEAATEEAPAPDAAEEVVTEEAGAAEEMTTEEVVIEDEPAVEGTETADAPAEETVTEEPAAEEPAAETVAVVAGDPEAGERVFRRCQACHKMEDGRNGVGPHLYGIVGRPIGAVEDFRYSNTLAEMGGTWTPEEIAAFLEKPRDYAPGTKMAFAGLRDAEDIDDVIAYMATYGE